MTTPHQDLIAARIFRFRKGAFNSCILQEYKNTGGGYDPDVWEWSDVPYSEEYQSLLSSAIGQEGDNPGFESIEEAVFSINYWRNVAHSLQQELTAIGEAPTKAKQDYTVWLLEKEERGRILYLYYDEWGFKFTPDANKAIHFARREDADAVGGGSEDFLRIVW